MTEPWLPSGALWAGATEATDGPNLFGFLIQHLDITGTVSLDGQEWPIDATGWRHRVRTAPWAGDVIGHHFVHVRFPSGRIIGFQHVTTTSQSGGFGYVGDLNGIEQAAIISINDWDGLIAEGEMISVTLRTELGRKVTMSGVSRKNVAIMQMTEDSFAPVSWEHGDRLLALFADTHWTADGESAWAAWERTRLTRLVKPR